jgi:AraC-like DNA-binding protein
VRIVRRLVDPSKMTLAPFNGLPRERLQRVCDYIEANLDDGLTLADLAGVACLSPYQLQPVLQAGGRRRTAVLRHATADRTGKNPDTAE